MAEHGRAWVRPDRHNVKLGNVLQEFDLVAAFPMFALCLRYVAVCLRYVAVLQYPRRAFVWCRSEVVTARKPYKHTNKKRKKNKTNLPTHQKSPQKGASRFRVIGQNHLGNIKG